MSSEEGTLTLKSLQSHLIKTVLGSVASAIVAGVIMFFIFYWNTTYTLDSLIKTTEETKAIVDKHSEQLNSSNNSNSVSNIEIKNLQQRMSAIEESQKDIVKLLIEINMSQKTLVKNSK